MTRIDFYQIDTNEPMLLFACRLIDKAWRQGHQIYAYSNDEATAAGLDDLLWTFRPDRFVPHARMTDGVIDHSPIHIGCSVDPGEHNDVLVNLSGTIPENFSRFSRVAEVVPLRESVREQARINYRFYRDRGYPLKYHAIGSK